MSARNTPWLTFVILAAYAERRIELEASKAYHSATIITVLITDACRMPIRSEMLTYRHQPRYCLKNLKTVSLIMRINSSKSGYCCTSQVR